MNRIIIFLLTTLFSSLAALAQTPVPTPPPVVLEEKGEINFDSRLVVVPVSVTDGNGLPVKGLGAEDFNLKENGTIQEIAEVSNADEVPLEIALLFDISASTDPMFKFEQETAAKFLQEVMRPQDRATIFTIGEVPRLIQTRNVAYRSIETIKAIQPTKEYTAFFDTVSAAARYLRENSDSKSRRVVIAITDGEDTQSEGIKRGFFELERELGSKINTITVKEQRRLRVEKRDQVRVREQQKTLKFLQDADTVFYSINPAGTSYKLNKISKFGQGVMSHFAKETGGEAFLPKFQSINLKSEFQNATNMARNSKMLNQIFTRLRNELQAQYLVQYYSNNELKANQYVDVDLNVQLTLPQGVKIQSRKGYFVKK